MYSYNRIPENFKAIPHNFDDGDRFFFAAPFLTGALIGGAAVGLSRPRPYYYAPYPAYPSYPYPYYPYPRYY